MCSADIFLGLLALLFPPLPVWVKCGICSADSLINILLCALGYIPGLLHSWYIIAKFPEPSYEYETLPQHNEGGHEGGRVTYVFVHGPGNRSQRVQTQQPKPTAPPAANYGTTSNNGTGGAPAPQAQQGNGEGSSDNAAPPPTYAEVVGDNKVQTHD